MEIPYFSVPDLCERYDIKQSTLYNWLSTLAFPQPMKFGRLSRWKLEDVEQWESEQPQEITQAPAARIEGVKRAIQSRRGKKAAYTIEQRAIIVPAPLGYAPKQMIVSVRVPKPTKQAKEVH